MRSYRQYCAVAKALDLIGERWTLLIVRELLCGPRRYSGLLADLPGISTDVLAARLREMERDGLLTRRPASPGASAYVYDLTPDGHALSPILETLALWGAPRLDDRSPTDAHRPHWLALPLARRLRAATDLAAATVEVRLEDGTFHVRLGDRDDAGGAARPAGVAGVADGERGVVGYGDGPARRPDAVLATDHATAAAIAAGRVSVTEATRTGRATLTGAGAVTGDPLTGPRPA